MRSVCLAALCLTLMLICGCAARQHSAEARGETSASTIVEGVGWKGFHVGATKQQLIAALGEPDKVRRDLAELPGGG